MGDRHLMRLSPLALPCIWNRWTTTSGGWEFNRVERTSIFGSLWKMGVYAFGFPIKMTKTHTGKATTGRGRCRERRVSTTSTNRTHLLVRYHLLVTRKDLDRATILARVHRGHLCWLVPTRTATGPTADPSQNRDATRECLDHVAKGHPAYDSWCWPRCWPNALRHEAEQQ